MISIKNKVVWITGASSGIGEELAYQLAKEGAFLVLTARNLDLLEKVKKRCLEYTSQCYIETIDLLDLNAIEKGFNNIILQVGKIDILINNAGRSQRSFAVETPIENDRMLMEVNFFSAIQVTKLVLPTMIEHQSGSIVVISSLAGKFGFPMRTAYSASKHALQGFFESLRTEVSKQNIYITIVSPGRIHTNISLHALAKDGREHGKMDDGQRYGMPVKECVTKIVKAIKNQKKELLVGKNDIYLAYIRRFLPLLYYQIVTKIKP